MVRSRRIRDLFILDGLQTRCWENSSNLTMNGCTLFLLKSGTFDELVEAGNFNLVALLRVSKYEVCPLMLLTGLGVVWEKQPRKLEALDCSAGANIRSRRSMIGKLREI